MKQFSLWLISGWMLSCAAAVGPQDGASADATSADVVADRSRPADDAAPLVCNDSGIAPPPFGNHNCAQGAGDCSLWLHRLASSQADRVRSACSHAAGDLCAISDGCDNPDDVESCHCGAGPRCGPGQVCAQQFGTGRIACECIMPR